MRSYTQKPKPTSRVIGSKPRVSRQADIKEILQTYNPNPVQKRDVVPMPARQQGQCGVLQREINPDVLASLDIPIYQKPETTTCWFLSILHGIYKAGWVKDLFDRNVIAVAKTGENQYHCVEGDRAIDVVYAVDGRPLWQQILEGFINRDAAAMNTIVAGIDNETKATETAKTAKTAKIAETASPIFTTTTIDTTTTKPVEKTKTTKTGTKEAGTTKTTIKTATTTTTTTTIITATYTAAAIITIVTDTDTATTTTTTTTTTVTVAPPILPGSPSAAPVTTVTPVTTTTPPVNSTKNELISSDLFSVKDQFSFDKINNIGGGGINRTPAMIKAAVQFFLNMINKDWQIQDAQSISPSGATAEGSPFRQMVEKGYLSKLEDLDQEMLKVMTVEKNGHAMGVNNVSFAAGANPSIKGVKISGLEVFNQSYVEGGASNALNVNETFRKKNTQKYKDIVPGVVGNVSAIPEGEIPTWAKDINYINYYKLARKRHPVAEP